MKLVNSEIILAKKDLPENLSSQSIEKELNSRGIDFIRWAIVSADEDNFVLNVSHKVEA